MTRKQVAEYLQLSKQTISRYEKTNKTPKAI
ncbi:MAG: helix-turn-helix domain-containing protein [Piscirickettsiaceae bacterium]|nr:helix-turn-helix domain-containing protein [Piscirickettsiaceae bacterium]